MVESCCSIEGNGLTRLLILVWFGRSEVYVRKLDLGFYNALFSSHSAAESKGRRTTRHGAIC